MEQVQGIRVELIVRDKTQPRTQFNQEALEQLANSMKAEGLLQPITLRWNGDGEYLVVAGERRYRAACMLGWDKIPAIVREMDDSTHRKLQMIENVVRESLNPVEFAKGMQRMVDEGMSCIEIDDALGQTRGEAKWHLQILECCDVALHLITTGQIGQWVAWHLGRLSLNGQMKALRIFQLRQFSAGQMKAICEAIYGDENQIAMFEEAALTSPEQQVTVQFMKSLKHLLRDFRRLSNLEERKPGSVMAMANGQGEIAQMQVKEMVKQLNWLDKQLMKSEAIKEV